METFLIDFSHRSSQEKQSNSQEQTNNSQEELNSPQDYLNHRASKGKLSYHFHESVKALRVETAFICFQTKTGRKCDFEGASHALHDIEIIGHDKCVGRIRDIINKGQFPGSNTYHVTDGDIIFTFHNVSRSYQNLKNKVTN